MSFSQDLTFAIRSMRKSPGLTTIAVLALALGMGANTAIFSVVNSMLLNSAPMRSLRDPDRLVMLWEKNPAMMAFIAERISPAAQNVIEWRSRSRSFAAMTAFLKGKFAVGSQVASAGQPIERAEGVRIEPNFFDVLGVAPAVGRFFTREDAEAGAGRVAILSAKEYRKRFGNDTNLSGKKLRVDGIERSIIGILPETFTLPAMHAGEEQTNPDVLIPLSLKDAKTPEEKWIRIYFVYARLRPGVILAQARNEMNAISARLYQQYKGPEEGFGVNVFPVSVEDVGPDIRNSVFVLQAAVGFVLLIACANVANLLLARAVGRQREIAIRLAIGATRWRIVRQMLTESLLLSSLGAAAGLLLAFWSLDLISAIAPTDYHGFHELRLDPTVLLFTFAVCVVTGVLFGLAPAWHAAHSSVNESLTQGGRTITSGPQWLRNSMVVAEVSLALILMVSAGLMIRSLRAVMQVDPGFRTDHLLTMQMSLTRPDDSTQKPDEKADYQRQKAFADAFLQRAKEIPGITSVSLSSDLPMESVTETSFDLEGVPKDKNWRIAERSFVSEDYLGTIGARIVRGRGFTAAEAEAEHPAAMIVSESFAHQFWPNQDPIGKIVVMPSGTPNKDDRLRVVGVVANMHQMGPDNELKPEMYIARRVFPYVYIAARTVGDPMSVKDALQKVIWSIDPTQPIDEVRTMDKVLHEWPKTRRFYMTILGIFAGLALLLASLGLYGVLAYVVSLRTRELGIRVALGAGTRELLHLVVGQGMKLAALGIAIGMLGAFLLTRLMQSLIFQVSTSDPVTFTLVAVGLLAVAALASWIPARRATRVNPVDALRAE